MKKIIISDTSCLIALTKIERLVLLKDIFGQVIISKEVQEEFGLDLPEWIKVVKNTNTKKQTELEGKLDKGEASAIALALTFEDSILIIDEKKGRKIAQDLDLEIIGTLRILLLAKEKNLIENIKSEVEKLNQQGFRFSKAIINKLLNGE